MGHHCHARGCMVATNPELLMCLRHWLMVPRDLQRRVWATYRPGQCDDKKPSAAWQGAAAEAIAVVAEVEGGAPMSLRITATIDPPGPHARAMLEERPTAVNRSVCPKGCSYGAYRAGTNGKGRGDIWECGCGMRWSDTSDPWGAQLAAPQPSPRPTVANLLRDIAAGIRVLRDRDGVPLTDEQIDERSRNICQALLGSYEITGVAP